MTDPKLQRLLDLLTALLNHQSPLTFTELAKEVPAYLADGSVDAERPSATVKMQFERDKRELLKMGVAFVVGTRSTNEEADESTYRLPTRDFYLPYLGIVSARGVREPARVDRYGYRSLETLAFESDELRALAYAGKRAMQVGDPLLADSAQSAMRKLAFDLPLDEMGNAPDGVIVAPKDRADPKVLGALGDALVRRKQVTFQYRGMSADPASTRKAEPYGLYFVNGHWYLAARDIDKNAMRNFRVSRTTKPDVNKKNPETPDYVIPEKFSLREYARARQAWELGDGDAYDAVVDFRALTGAGVAAASLGLPDPSSPTRRRFKVRRTNSFARWLLSLAGEATPIEPPALVQEYENTRRDTRAHYQMVTIDA